MSNSSELMINKATTAEGRPTVAMTSPACKDSWCSYQEKDLSLIDKEIANEESAPDVEVKSVVEEDAGFQIKIFHLHIILSTLNQETGGFERNGFVSGDTQSLFPH